MDLYKAKRASANGVIYRNIYRLKEQQLSLWASATITTNNSVVVSYVPDSAKLKSMDSLEAIVRHLVLINSSLERLLNH